MLISSRLRHHRLIALVAAITMVVVICGYTSHEMIAQPCHCDWTMHFTGVAGSAAHPVAIVKPLLAAWRIPTTVATASPSPRKLRAHPARGPPDALSVS